MDRNNGTNSIKENESKEEFLKGKRLILGDREILEEFINATNIGIWEWNIKTGELVINEKYASIIGYRLDELIPFSIEAWRKHVHKDDREKVEKCLQEQIDGISEYYDCEFRLRHKENGWIWVHNRGKTISWEEDGKPLAMLGLTFYIPERKKSEVEKLNLATAFEQASITVVMTDKNGNILYGNPAFERISGYSLEEAIGKNPRILKSGLTPDSVFIDLWDTIGQGKNWQGEFINKRKDGSLYYEEVRITPIIDDNGDIINFLGIKQDISERKYLEEKLRQSSIRDHLTNAYNRRYVFERLSEMIKLYKKNGENFSLGIIDLDLFKNVNDKYGHLAGDFILKEFVEIINSCIRDYDILGRYGGEEFILVLNGIGKEHTERVIGRILNKVRETKFNYEGNEINITCSCGISEVSEIPKDILSVEKLVNEADTRLYKAKDTGRDRIVID